MNRNFAAKVRFRISSAASTIASPISFDAAGLRGVWRRLALPLAVACCLPGSVTMAQTTEPVGTTSSVLTATITITTAGTGGTVNVLTQGVQNLDFKLADTNGTCNMNGTSYSYAVNATCTVDYTFTPTAPGQRLGAIQLVTSSGTLLGNTYVSGIGTGPQITYTAPSAGIDAPPATASIYGSFSAPYGVAVDPSGNVYVVNQGGGPLTKTGPNCASASCFTNLGNLIEPAAVALDGAGNVFIVHDGGYLIEFPFNASNGTYATGITFFHGTDIGGIAIDGAGNLFFADEISDQIGKLAAVNGVMPVSPTPIYLLTGLSEPIGIAVDATGNVFYSEYGSRHVSELPFSSGNYGTPVILASSFGFIGPTGIALDGAGNVYVADTRAGNLYQIVAIGGTVSASSSVKTLTTNTIAGSGVAVDGNGNVYFTKNNAGEVSVLLYGSASTPPVLSFPTATPDGTTDTQDGTRSFFINNEGNATLNLSALTIPTGFAQVAGSGTPADCTGTTSLAPGASCNVSIEFEPVSPQNGALSESIAVSSNLGSHTITLQATAINAALTVTAISPSSGGSTGGSTVTITGTGFTNATTVHFGGTAASFTVVSSTTITATVPTGTGKVDVTVTAGGVTSVTSAADKYSYLTATTVVPSVALTQNTAIASSITPVTATGGVGTLSYTISPNLPAGLSFSQTTGAITGKPTSSSASATYTVTATDANGATASSTFVLTVASPVTASTVAFFSLVQFPYGISPSPFVPVKASGGTGSLTYTISPALPTGLTIDSGNGAITGTVIQATPTITYTVTATDANGSSASSTFQMNVKAPAITVEPQSLPAADLGTYYNQTITAKGGTSPYTFSLTSGSLPPGLMLTTAGILSGTPSAAGSYAITITATDSSGGSGPYTGSGTWTLTVNGPVTATTGLSYLTVELTYNTSASSFTPVTATGGTGSLTYTISPTLPAGLSFNAATGAITGTPSRTTSTIVYTVTATDVNGSSASSVFVMLVDPPNIQLAPNHLPAAQVGVPYSQTVTASAGTAPYTFATLAGYALPPGLSINPQTGLISGTPTAAGSFTVAIKATDSSPAPSGPFSGSLQITFTVDPGVPGLAFAAATASGTYTYGQSATVLATSASPAPIVYSVVSGPATINASSGALTFSGVGAVVVSAAQVSTANYQAASTQATLQAGQEPSVTLFTPPSATSIPAGQSITLIATVTAGYGVGTPTGNVAFVGGVNGTSTLLGSVAVANGSAQFTYSGPALPPGTYVITALYTGDGNFLPSSTTLTNAVTITPYSFSVALPTTGSGSGGSGGPPVSVALPGQPASLSLQLVPAQGTFLAPVSFTVTGLPTGATYTVNPNPIPAGSGPTAVIVTVNLPTQDVRNMPDGHSFGRDARSLIALALLLPLAGFTGLRRGRRMLHNTTRLVLLLILATAALASLGGCASGSGFFNTPPHSYTATVTATSGSLTANMNFQLEVQ